MKIMIDTNKAMPLYEQIVSQICEAILEGKIAIGAMLPPIRQLALDLEINHNTVARAYQFLDQNGVTITAGRNGTFINKNAVENINNQAEMRFSVKLKNLLEESKNLGLSKKIINEIFKKIISEISMKEVK